MLTVRGQPADLGEPVVTTGLSTVVILDANGNPLIAAQEMQAGATVVYTHRDPNFKAALKALGIGLNTRYAEVKKG